MAGERFHGKAADKRRGGNLPARLRFTARRGVTLIELMIAMLILAIVCVSWLEIIGIQSAKKEARRREAVERLAGMMDAFMYVMKDNEGSSLKGYYVMDETNKLPFRRIQNGDADVVQSFNPDLTSIGYRLSVIAKPEWPQKAMAADWSPHYWLEGQLYDRTGNVNDVGKPFFILRVCLGYY